MSLFYTFIALFLGSLGSILLSGSLLFLNTTRIEKISTYLTYFAGGTLLGAAFLGMIPKASAMLNVADVLKITLAGILFFFALEKFILWRTCRNSNCERHVHAVAPVILIGDAFHNAIDGIVIATAFLVSPESGLFTTLSVIFHEIPQELGDFGILLKSGLTKKKALFWNMISGSTAIITGVAAHFMLNELRVVIPYALAFSAASFLYIALADLIPEMHSKTRLKDSLVQFSLIVAGIVVIFLLIKSK